MLSGSCMFLCTQAHFHTSPSWAHLQSSDSTLLMMSARSKGNGMLGSSTPQKGRSTGASSGGNVWARLEWHLRRQDTGTNRPVNSSSPLNQTHTEIVNTSQVILKTRSAAISCQSRICHKCNCREFYKTHSVLKPDDSRWRSFYLLGALKGPVPQMSSC